MKAPSDEVIRSNIRLRTYCKENKIELDNLLANFSQNNIYEGPIYLYRYTNDLGKRPIAQS